MLSSPPSSMLGASYPLRGDIEHWTPELMLGKTSKICKEDKKKQGKEYIHRGNNNGK